VSFTVTDRRCFIRSTEKVSVSCDQKSQPKDEVMAALIRARSRAASPLYFLRFLLM
jgi:hypothetical protein